jgi:glyoxylase-like metal-dependent hydrolase (beta-lactamase superfamily II)
MDYRIISIGTLSRHELWEESTSDRTAHATTTLVHSGDRIILVDPALPPQVITARLAERAGLAPAQITDIFLTNFRPAHRMGLTAFEHATWHIFETEREVVGQNLFSQLQDEQDEPMRQLLEQEIALLKRCKPSPDKLAEHVDLFPLPGFTPGTCGLLLTAMNTTILIASDAIPTIEHLEKGRVQRSCYDANQAQESFVEAIEIADLIIPGHDNIQVNMTRRPY